MAAKSPAFQFYPKDWLSSPKVLLMSPAEEGAYIRLLCYCWDSGDCSLPDDDKQLAVLSRLGKGWFNQRSTTSMQLVRSCFIQHPEKEGFLTNERLYQERKKQDVWREKSSIGGKKSAGKRAEKPEKQADKSSLKGGSTKGQPTGVQVVEPNGNSSSASSLASSSAFKTPIPPLLDTERFRLAFSLWVRHRGKKATPAAQEGAMRKLARWGETRAVAAIEHSVSNGWDGIFEPGEKHGTSGSNGVGRIGRAEAEPGKYAHKDVNERDYDDPDSGDADLFGPTAGSPDAGSS